MTSPREHGMSLIVRTVTRLTVGLILLYGIYIVLHGHVSPGGGFAGGVIIALSFVHLMLAFGRETAMQALSESRGALVESLGATLFLVIALLGFGGGHFFVNFLGQGEPFTLFSAGAIPLSNISIALKVGGGLFAAAVALVLMRLEPEK
ncbi:MAG: MnhB domain-containing protein [Candidatus Hydrogenedentota bacterium]